jgi:hypothetical protein
LELGISLESCNELTNGRVQPSDFRLRAGMHQTAACF